MIKKYQYYLTEKKKYPKYNIGDTVYYITAFTITAEFHGRNKIKDIFESDGYWYELEKWNGRTLRWISEEELTNDEDVFNKWNIEQKDIRSKENRERKKEKEEKERKKEELRLKMLDIDPYSEEDWLSEMLNINEVDIGGRYIYSCTGSDKLYGKECIVKHKEKGTSQVVLEFDEPVGVNIDEKWGRRGYCIWSVSEHLKRLNDKVMRKVKRAEYAANPYDEEIWDQTNERKVSYKKHLCPDLWDEDKKLKERIRNKLMRIAKDFYDDMEIEVELLDVHLTGSIANYNYNAASDIDVHLVVDYEEINSDIELVEMAVDGIRYVWNMRHNIVIHGHDVELYVQNSKGEHTSTGVYSIMFDKWIKKPVYNRPTIDQVDVDNKYEARVSDIDRFYKVSKQDLSPEEAEEYYKAARQLKKKIMKGRQEGLHIVGEFSLENLVFKKLRKTGKFGKLIDTITRLYDKIYSQ